MNFHAAVRGFAVNMIGGSLLWGFVVVAVLGHFFADFFFLLGYFATLGS